jgi:hypothetical protein
VSWHLKAFVIMFDRVMLVSVMRVMRGGAVS